MVPVAGAVEATGLRLSPTEELVLAALSHRPLGLYPVTSVAVAAGVEVAAASEALARLVDLGLVHCREEPVVSRPVRREHVWTLAPEAWWHAADVLRHTPVPAAATGAMPDRLPDRFRHLFWSGDGDASRYRLPADAVFVAERILTSDDVTSWGWALLTLPVEALEEVAARPHVARDRRDLAADAAAWRRGNAC